MLKNTSKSQKSVATTKAGKIIGMLRSKSGATIAELAKATGWQDHSIRGFLSGTLKKRQGVAFRSIQEEDKPRRYFIDRVKA